MPRRPKAATPDASHAPIPSEILDQFVRQGPLTPEELDTAVGRFKKAIIERALGAELSHHLGYVAGGTKPEDTTNHRNGSSGKTVLTDDGPLALAVPRDRDGSFEPRLIGKHERRFTGFDDKVVALYDRDACIDILVEAGSTPDEAEEYFDFNVTGAYVGESTPAFATILRKALDTGAGDV